MDNNHQDKTSGQQQPQQQPQQPQQQQTSGFELHLIIRKQDTGEPIKFKLDGARFEKEQPDIPGSEMLTRTYKFYTDAIYKITINTKPATEFLSIHISGSDLELRPEHIGTGSYSTEWNTTGFDVTRNGKREYITFTLQGPGQMLKRTLQAKFYSIDDSHGNYGDNVDSLIWKCVVLDTATANVVDEIVT